MKQKHSHHRLLVKCYFVSRKSSSSLRHWLDNTTQTMRDQLKDIMQQGLWLETLRLILVAIVNIHIRTWIRSPPVFMRHMWTSSSYNIVCAPCHRNGWRGHQAKGFCKTSKCRSMSSLLWIHFPRKSSPLTFFGSDTGAGTEWEFYSYTSGNNDRFLPLGTLKSLIAGFLGGDVDTLLFPSWYMTIAGYWGLFAVTCSVKGEGVFAVRFTCVVDTWHLAAQVRQVPTTLLCAC